MEKTKPMKLFRWIKGRQKTAEYHKWCFLYFKFLNIGVDGYLLKYETGISLPIHKDPIKGRHYRLNIKLKGISKFWCPSTIFRFKEQIVFFRPDIFYHSLNVYSKTYKLSFGLAIFNKSTK